MTGKPQPKPTTRPPATYSWCFTTQKKWSLFFNITNAGALKDKWDLQGGPLQNPGEIIRGVSDMGPLLQYRVTCIHPIYLNLFIFKAIYSALF